MYCMMLKMLAAVHFQQHDAMQECLSASKLTSSWANSCCLCSFDDVLTLTPVSDMVSLDRIYRRVDCLQLCAQGSARKLYNWTLKPCQG